MLAISQPCPRCGELVSCEGREIGVIMRLCETCATWEQAREIYPKSFWLAQPETQRWLSMSGREENSWKRWFWEERGLMVR